MVSTGRLRPPRRSRRVGREQRWLSILTATGRSCLAATQKSARPTRPGSRTVFDGSNAIRSRVHLDSPMPRSCTTRRTIRQSSLVVPTTSPAMRPTSIASSRGLSVVRASRRRNVTPDSVPTASVVRRHVAEAIRPTVRCVACKPARRSMARVLCLVALTRVEHRPVSAISPKPATGSTRSVRRTRFGPQHTCAIRRAARVTRRSRALERAHRARPRIPSRQGRSAALHPASAVDRRNATVSPCCAHHSTHLRRTGRPATEACVGMVRAVSMQ